VAVDHNARFLSLSERSKQVQKERLTTALLEESFS
jgi:hypothetical protein